MMPLYSYLGCHLSVLSEPIYQYLQMRILKSVGGHDYKDFIVRSLKHLLSNRLAETCSWTGRKNNYELRNLKITKCIFGKYFKF